MDILLGSIADAARFYCWKYTAKRFSRESAGSWNDREAGTKVYPKHGGATYHLLLKTPSTLKDPALRIKTVATAYKLYANGGLIAEVGKVSDEPSDFKEGEQQLIVDLPKDKPEMELILQVANLNYAKGGLRESPVFGSKQVLERQKMMLLALQLLFIGSVIIFGIYYLLIFFLHRKNKTALLFSILCFITALRSLTAKTKTQMAININIALSLLQSTAFIKIPMM